jgi:hypothetical protein
MIASAENEGTDGIFLDDTTIDEEQEERIPLDNNI